nr:Chain C, Protein E6 [Human papillomavirus 16]4JOP_D Chain D, Protein E6 [Human papillomavirus 16]7VZE_E Chain E, the PDZ-binding motif of HPV16 E6 [Human papillomavirus 16]7VZE_F Chain F, the PDZ-binding motif of HPV16 E6 [Human papillomavirus 16]7VZE_G Chain G, the PDZ-binding motif of HPV16 E6 [Human papillomavirus 16]7VZE_H Chain H, the PDZ-binding motif of HPV16 E6 [Human papillomavirus 16]
TRRETQL